MTGSDRGFEDAPRGAAPVDDYLREIDALVAAHDCRAQDRVGPAIDRGMASHEVACRAALERYYVVRWTTPELPMLVANAPDVYSFTLDDSMHFRHWAERFAGAAGYLRGPDRVRLGIERCRQLGLDDAAVRAYAPLPETIAMVCTTLFYVRRSYEEGLAVLHHGGAYVGAPDRDAETADLLRKVVTTRAAQDRCREAVRNVVLTAECRVRAMNRWLE